jgi:hypothetical protein
MATDINIHLDFSTSDGSLKFEDSVHDEHDSSAEGKQALAREIFAELRKAVNLADYGKSLPETADLMVAGTGGTRSDAMAFLDMMNVPALWQEIHNTFLDLRYLLAQARAYKDLEPAGTTPISDSLCAHLHFEKMHNLNLAMFQIVRIQDLVVRLLHEGFSGRLIDVDYDEEGWEKDLRLVDAKKGLKNLLDSRELSQIEHDEIMDALNTPAKSTGLGTVVKYRNRLAHRILASVDYPEIFTHVHDRAGEVMRDASGIEKGRRYSISVGRSKPEFTFPELYAALVDYMSHIATMLNALRRTARLS